MSEQENIDLWVKAKELIKKRVAKKAYETWFAPTKGGRSSKEEVDVGVPNKFSQEWISEHYAGLIKEVLLSLGVVGGRFSLGILSGQAPDSLKEKEEPQNISEPGRRLRLNSRYTFAAFVVGSCNRFAHAASLAVAESPARAYNPLFIYGGVGLGKTHLMQAIAAYIIEKAPSAKAVYISSERFTNQLISAIKNRGMEDFRQRYRGLDILLIDDIHFIAGKESTQEEFFHTFNTLYDAHKQIVVTSDRPPKEIPRLEERLVSRFSWGLITDIQPPELETRIAILKKKAERERVVVPEEVSFFLAERIKSNIRELEGALIRVTAYASLVGVNIDVRLAQEVLKDTLLKEEREKIGVDLIQKKVAEYFDTRISDMKGNKKTRDIVYPRQIAIYLSRVLTDESLVRIGEWFNGKDHSTILHAYNKILKEIKESPASKGIVDKLVRIIKKPN